MQTLKAILLSSLLSFFASHVVAATFDVDSAADPYEAIVVEVQSGNASTATVGGGLLDPSSPFTSDDEGPLSLGFIRLGVSARDVTLTAFANASMNSASCTLLIARLDKATGNACAGGIDFVEQEMVVSRTENDVVGEFQTVNFTGIRSSDAHHLTVSAIGGVLTFSFFDEFRVSLVPSQINDPSPFNSVGVALAADLNGALNSGSTLIFDISPAVGTPGANINGVIA
ncbi:MAG: hypothetical protein AAF665_14060 [Pseudomonadota bacterium]